MEAWRQRCFSPPPSILPYLLLFLFAACDNSFEPISETGTDAFAVYGVLDTEADTQFVRVSPLRNRLALDAAAAQPTVTSTELATGRQVVWQDSLVQLDDGTTGLLFYMTRPVAPGEAYRLDVQGSGPEVTSAFTQVPPSTGIVLGSVRRDFNRNFIQKVTLPGLRRSPSTTVLYRVRPPGASEPVLLHLPLFSAAEPVPDGLELTVQLELDRETILQRLGLPRTDSSVVLLDVGLEVERLSEEWATPEMPRNIENGFGFFGAIARYVETWTLDAATLEEIGFRPPG